MKKIFLFLSVFVLVAACELENSVCSISIEVPFVSIDIPDSVENDKKFIIDAELFDHGCVKSCELGYTFHNRDTLIVCAMALRDECDCPKESTTTADGTLRLDTTQFSNNVCFAYMQVNETQDSIHWAFKSIKIY